MEPIKITALGLLVSAASVLYITISFNRRIQALEEQIKKIKKL